MAVVPGYWITTGWVSRGELYTNGLQIKNFPIQSDMNDGRAWIRPGNNADILKPARLIDTPVGTRYAYGGIVWNWPMVNLSPKMVNYIQTTYFQPNGPSGSFFFREWSNKLTVQTFNRASGEWETYHTWARLGDFENDASPQAGGYTDLKIQFTAYGVAPDGPDVLPIVIATQDTVYQYVNFSTTVRVQNVGDVVTFDNTQWSMPIPTNTQLVSVGGAWPSTIEYSDDNGETYSGTPPSPVSLTTHIRVTLTDELDPGESTSNYTVVLFPTAPGDKVFTVTANTDGDNNTGNNVDTETIPVEAFSPIVYAPALWLDANEGVFADNGFTTPAVNTDEVGGWQDQSGNDNHFSNATPAESPIYLTAQANGNAALSFNGIDQTLINGNANSPALSSGVTFVFVIDAANDDSSPGAEAFYDTTYTLSHMVDDSPFTHTGVYDGTTWRPIIEANSGLQIVTFVIDPNLANDITLYRNSVAEGISAAATLTQGASARIGGEGVSSNVFEGLIYEIVAYNSVLTNTQRTYVEDYLKNKYGIL